MNDIIVRFNVPNLEMMVLNDDYTVALYHQPNHQCRVALLQGVWDTSELRKYFSCSIFDHPANKYCINTVTRFDYASVSHLFRSVEKFLFKDHSEYKGFDNIEVVSFGRTITTEQELRELGHQLASFYRQLMDVKLQEASLTNTPAKNGTRSTTPSKDTTSDTTDDHNRRATDMLITTSLLSTSSSSYSSSSSSDGSFSSGD